MAHYLYIILLYLVVLTGLNFWRARKVKSQEDFMVAGRTLSMPVMVFTLICTWIGSGTFIAGAEFAYHAGLSSLWMAAGAWVGIIMIYFLAAKIRSFGQYTIGDILEVRYGSVARIFGSVALIISFTAIVSYQFRAGGLILNVVTQRPDEVSLLKLKADVALPAQVSPACAGDGQGQVLAQQLKIFPDRYDYLTQGGQSCSLPKAMVSEREYDATFSRETGQLITAIFVILFTAIAGMVAVAYTDLPNGIIILLACLISVPFVVFKAGGLEGIMTILPQGHFSLVNEQFGRHPYLKAGSYFLATMLLLLGVQSMYQKFYSAKTEREAKGAVAFWTLGTVVVETIVVVIAIFAAAYFWNKGYDPASMVLLAARDMVPTVVGVLLLGAACAVVISTAMNYLLSPTTNIMRDIYQRFINPDASAARMVALQKVCVVILGILAFLVATQMKSVLEMAYFAYTIYGVSITPALLAALVWKRATKAGGLTSIVAGTVVCVGLKVLTYILPAAMVPEGDPFGIPLIYPSLLASLLGLVVVSYLTPPPSAETLAKLFPDKKAQSV